MFDRNKWRRRHRKNIVKYALGMGIGECLLYALTPLIGMIIVEGIAKNCEEIASSILKGYLKKNEQINYMASNI